jgi:hypothetical protein
MTLQNLFEWKDHAEIRRTASIKKASTLDSAKSVLFYDRHIADVIADYKEAITILEEYRQTLCARYQEIINAPFKCVLKLERVINRYDNTKSYVLTVVKRFEGESIRDEELRREVYEGKERHKALKRLEALKKEYPNIETEIDIEKKRWEK